MHNSVENLLHNKPLMKRNAFFRFTNTLPERTYTVQFSV